MLSFGEHRECLKTAGEIYKTLCGSVDLIGPDKVGAIFADDERVLNGIVPKGMDPDILREYCIAFGKAICEGVPAKIEDLVSQVRFQRALKKRFG